jgi:hypothetical protein
MLAFPPVLSAARSIAAKLDDRGLGDIEQGRAIELG